ncbi:oxidoreductase [Paracoccus alkanivorans]|uniref:Oxidoreductase n=1 Tax=Paracoccus alkanivorans TaxID=2116655 RepID=A0A3M0M391_9RHOB|nr:oxidoreductase [Paracoccus alkanivorans]RMC31613.1 oxidoreductase [Paracoccus alkanivorans]
MTQTSPAAAAGRFTFPGTDISVNRMGYGAMQLAGPHVFGPPADPEECRAVLKEAIALGVDHIDTSDFYGPHVTNDLIREALYPYDESLTLVTKIGAWRDDKGDWILERSADFLRKSVEDNLERLGLERMPIVNLRMGGPEDDIAAPMQVMRDMQEEGLIAHIGISTVDMAQLGIARDIAPVVCVQNQYNLVQRGDDAMIDALAEDGIAYVPYFPLGGFTPLQADALSGVAEDLGQSPQSVALAWLLQRSPNILLIPGTSRRAHLRENVAAAGLKLDEASLKRLDAIVSAV